MTAGALQHPVDCFAELQQSGVYVLYDPATRPDWPAVLAGLQDAGVRWFQLRSKSTPTDRLRRLASQARSILNRSTLIINDHAEIAYQCQADGVHVGPGDLSPAVVRQSFSGLLVGRSGDDPATMSGAGAAAVDYFGVGTVHVTTTKANAGRAIGVAGIQAATAVAEQPVVAIGGLTPGDMPELRAAGATGAAVMSAIWDQADPVAAAAEFLNAWQAQS